MYIPQLKYSKNTQLNNGISIFTAELLAILLALEWIEDVKPMHTCIFSDCLSAIQAISKPIPQNTIVCDIRHTLINIKHQGNTYFVMDSRALWNCGKRKSGPNCQIGHPEKLC